MLKLCQLQQQIMPPQSDISPLRIILITMYMTKREGTKECYQGQIYHKSV